MIKLRLSQKFSQQSEIMSTHPGSCNFWFPMLKRARFNQNNFPTEQWTNTVLVIKGISQHSLKWQLHEKRPPHHLGKCHKLLGICVQLNSTVLKFMLSRYIRLYTIVTDLLLRQYHSSSNVKKQHKKQISTKCRMSMEQAALKRIWIYIGGYFTRPPPCFRVK